VFIYINVLDHYETVYGRTKATATIICSEGYGSAFTHICLSGYNRYKSSGGTRNQEQIYERCWKTIARSTNKILDCCGSNHAVHLRHYGRAYDHVQNRLHVAVSHFCYHIPGVIFKF